MTVHRKCTVCGVEKPLTSANFYGNARNPSGYQYRCKGCDNRTRAQRMTLGWQATQARADAIHPRVSRRVCVRCCDLPHRRERGGCRSCGGAYAAEQMPTLADVLAQPVTDRRTPL